MLEERGELWDKYDAGHTIVITTNCTVRKNGCAVMGRGCAGQAKQRFPKLPKELGSAIRRFPTDTFYFPQYRLITMPVKHHWFDWATLTLILRGAATLAGMGQEQGIPRPIYLPRPGCGNGRLRWEAVKPHLAPLLDDNFIVMHNG